MPYNHTHTYAGRMRCIGLMGSGRNFTGRLLWPASAPLVSLPPISPLYPWRRQGVVHTVPYSPVIAVFGRARR